MTNDPRFNRLSDLTDDLVFKAFGDAADNLGVPLELLLERFASSDPPMSLLNQFGPGAFAGFGSDPGDIAPGDHPVLIRAQNLYSNTDPTTTDDSSKGYDRSSVWVNRLRNRIWICADPTADAAVWIPAKPTLSKMLIGNINNVWTKHFMAQPVVAQTTFANTYSIVTESPCTEFTHVRAILKNCEATPPSVTGVILAVTNSVATSRIVPSTGNTLTENGATGWVTATFAGSAVPILTAGTQTLPSVLVSDWIPLNSIASIDGGNPFIMGREKLGANFSALYTGTQNSTVGQMTYVQCRSANGDFVTTPSGFTAGNGVTSNITPIFGFEFMNAKRVVKVLCVGSSTTQGQGSTPSDSLFRSWVQRAQETFNASSIPVNMINYGYAGLASATYIAYGKAAIANHQPAIGALQVYTPNDGTLTQAIADTQFAQAVDWANYCISQDCLPLLVFTTPNENLDATQDGYRKALITRCKASGFAVLDMTTAVGDGASPEKFIPAFKFDALHPDDDGYDAMTEVAAETILDLIRNNFSW